MTNSLPWFFDGPNRNSLPINSMVDLSMAMLNNQRVYIFNEVALLSLEGCDNPSDPRV